jgi:hypothetical protein
MALLISDFASSQTKQVLVPAVPDKIILVVRFGLVTAANGSFVLLSDPNGTAEQNLTPVLYCYAYGQLDLTLGKRYGIAAARGKAVGFTSVVSGSPQDHGVLLWYEVVS